MKSLLSVKGRVGVFISTFVLVFASVFLIFQVETNYDMTEYLPQDSMTAEGMKLLEDTFGNHAAIQVMVSDVAILEAMVLKQEIASVDGVLQVEWLDDYVDMEDLASADPIYFGMFYLDEHALFTVVFEEGPFDFTVEEAIVTIRSSLDGYDVSMRGEALDNMAAREVAEGEVLSIILIILPISFLILLIASRSYLEPFIILGVLGVAVLFNMGTNALLPSVSFITLTLAAALQMAISLDYSLFMIHRFYEFRSSGESVHSAVLNAVRKAFPAITASALTTIFGFLALLFMRYGIGRDIGIVLSKGIVFSYLSVLFILPVVLVFSAPLLEKLKHRAWFFDLGAIRHLLIKGRYMFSMVLLVLVGVGFYFQSQADFVFGASEYTDEDTQVTVEREAIREVYGVYQPVVILFETEDVVKEQILVAELFGMDEVLHVEALVTTVDVSSVPKSMIPVEILSMYEIDGISRIIIYTDLYRENQAMFDFYERLDDTVGVVYESHYLLGVVPATYEIRDTVLADTWVVMVASIVAIGLVLMLVFRNLLIPLILLLVIQASIWVNVGVMGIFEVRVVYIGYLVVLALQLGATIDYAVLFMSRYIESRKVNDKESALYESLKRSSIPIMISGSVLATAGFAEAFYSDLSVVSDIGLLIGRGALLAVLFVLVFVPVLAYLFDRFIVKH